MAEIGFQFDAEGAWIAKDPNATKDYTINAAPWLDGDTIASVVWEVPAGLNKVDEGMTPTTAFVKLSGGVNGKTYVVTAHIHTTNGNDEDKSFRVVIRNV